MKSKTAGGLKMEFAFFYFFVIFACFMSLSLLPWREFCSLEQWALQPHRDQCHSQTVTHTYSETQTHKHIHKELPSTHTCVAHAHRHTLFHLAAILTSRLPGGEQLKDAPLSPLHNNLSNSLCHLYLRFPPPLNLSLTSHLSWQVKWW